MKTSFPDLSRQSQLYTWIPKVITYNIINSNPNGKQAVVTAPFSPNWLWSEELIELRYLIDYRSRLTSISCTLLII